MLHNTAIIKKINLQPAAAIFNIVADFSKNRFKQQVYIPKCKSRTFGDCLLTL